MLLTLILFTLTLGYLHCWCVDYQNRCADYQDWCADYQNWCADYQKWCAENARLKKGTDTELQLFGRCIAVQGFDVPNATWGSGTRT
jgi:hypothetical protein